MTELIPGLPDDVAEECLIRASYDRLSVIDSVCHRWRRLVRSQIFHLRRRLAGISRPLLLLHVQVPPFTTKSDSHEFLSHLNLFDPTSGNWRLLHPIPNLCSMMTSARAIGAGRFIVMIDASNSLHVYDFVTRSLREGAPMPGPPRRLFALACDGMRWVYIAGGMTTDNVLLPSAMRYDVEEDRWESLPNLPDGRRFVKGAFNNDKLFLISKIEYDIGGYLLYVFDLISTDWRVYELKGLKFNHRGFERFMLESNGLYFCQHHNLWITDGGRWHKLLDLPKSLSCYPYLTCWKGGVLVAAGDYGGERHIEPLKVYTLDLESDNKSSSWRMQRVPNGKGGMVNTGVWLEI